MKIIVPDYYKNFTCIASACRHTCCRGWEIDIDEDSLRKYGDHPEILRHISTEGVPHFELEGDRCPFLRPDQLCRLWIDRGEEFLCQICRDHPRFRNFWTDRIEIGLGLACEEAARLILSAEHPMTLEVLEDDGEETELPEDEAWLLELRGELLEQAAGSGPESRLLEYLIYRHVADALYDDKLEERITFIRKSRDTILDAWDRTDGSLDGLIECARAFSAEYEYADDLF